MAAEVSRAEGEGGAPRGRGCLQDWLGNWQRAQLQDEQSAQVVEPQSKENARPLATVIGSGPRRTQMRGGGGGGAAQDGVGCLAVFFSQEPTPSSMTDTWDPKTAGLEGPSRNELPTRALCQALKVGFFVNIVITLLRGRYRYPHFSRGAKSRFGDFPRRGGDFV